MKEIIKFVSSKPGPISVIVAGNHGNEVCGIEAFLELIPSLEICSGTVYWIIGNPNAVVENMRFTEFNLNRMFKPDNMLTDFEKTSYEYFRAQYLKQYFNMASAVLDIHSSITPNSVPFVICEKNAFEIAKELPVETIVHGFATANPGGVYSYVNAQGGIGIAIECGQHDDPKAKDVAREAILSFLQSRGHIKPGEKVIEEKAFFEAYIIYKSQTSYFRKNKEFADFEEVSKNQVIGIDGDIKVKAQEDSIILFAQNSQSAGDEVFVLCRQNSNH